MVEIKPGRQVGNTTRQMEELPKKAVFVWVNHHLQYPKGLAHKIGRGDLKIVSPEWLEDKGWAGLEISAIAVDHAAVLTERQYDGYRGAVTRIRT